MRKRHQQSKIRKDYYILQVSWQGYFITCHCERSTIMSKRRILNLVWKLNGLAQNNLHMLNLFQEMQLLLTSLLQFQKSLSCKSLHTNHTINQLPRPLVLGHQASSTPRTPASWPHTLCANLWLMNKIQVHG
jgi:hypothetical protein